MSNEITHNLLVSDKEQGIRLDKFIATRLPDISRTRIKTLIESNSVRLSGNNITDCSYRVKSGEEIEITIPQAAESDMRANDEIKLNIVYEDDEFLIIDKQAGLTVHPGAGNHDETMANALMAYCGDTLSGVGGVARPGIVHRLDKDTSGLILVAKTDRAHHSLSEQIAERTLTRMYLAVCWGVPKPHIGTIENYIGRNPKNRLKMMVTDNETGKVAITHYTVKKIYGGGVASLVECRLQTGRTHQIRVHMTELGHPLIGDPLYGKRNNTKMKLISEALRLFLKDFDRQALHSYLLGVEHPVTNDYIEMKSELPEDMKELVRLLEG
ncbi:MAG: rluD [Rickettsiaceae bacterium]|jgi:23S rRNA pseudouridine1911/1915/1917 synthase|nr:rluD [Rickettsiaceae bacterium]